MNHFESSTRRQIPTRTAATRYDSSDAKPSAENGSAASEPSSGRYSYRNFAARCIDGILHRCGGPAVRLVLPNGDSVDGRKDQASIGTITFRDYKTVVSVAMDPLFQFAEGYMDGRIEIEGSLAELMTAIYGAMNGSKATSSLDRLLAKLRLPNGNGLSRSLRNIRHHYDLGNDFYRLWLDEDMVYTCAYFARPAFTLEQAQQAKLEHICRKMQLQPGMEVVEAGCGWGALAMYMAEHYGVKVVACNVSKEQIEFAQERARDRGLAGQIEFLQEDWRKIRGSYDRFVSVGMLEHIGVKNYRQLGSVIQTCLKPEGSGLIHSIGQNAPLRMNPWIERRIFPGACIPAMSQIMQIFEPHGFSVLDVENLRLHYAMTLRHWLARFERSVAPIRSQFGVSFVRMWRMYLASCIASFETDYMQLFQVVFANARSNQVPLTREHQYSPISGSIPGLRELKETAGEADFSHSS